MGAQPDISVKSNPRSPVWLSATDPEVYVFATSYAQRSLWFLDQLAPGSALYNLQIDIRFDHEVDVDALREAINELVRRHESLRTAFKAIDGEPMQVILPSLRVSLPAVDLSHLSGARADVDLTRIANSDAGAPFDLTRCPLLRPRLMRLGRDSQVLLLTMHHIVTDHWSMDVLESELCAIYESLRAAMPSPLPAPVIQYADFAEWERQWLRGPVAQAQLDYWKRQLAGVEQLDIPTDRPRPQLTSFDGAAFDFEVPSSVLSALRSIALQERATLFMTALAALQTLLHRYTGQDDIVVGTPAANRNRPELENLIGFFANSLALRVNFSGAPSFRELLRRVRSVVLDAFVHQDMPFERLVSELRPDRAQGANPLFQVHFQVLSQFRPPEGPHRFDDDPVAMDASAAKFDLALDLWDSTDRLSGHLEYRTDLWGRDTIARLVRHFVNLLAAITADPDKPVSELSLLGAAERRRLIAAGTATHLERSAHDHLHSMFTAQVERTPDATALVFRGAEVTYQELHDRAERVASLLRSEGVGPESVVAVCAQRSIELVTALLGTLAAGAAFLPLNPSDPSERRAAILEDAQPDLVLTQHALRDGLAAHSPNVVCLDVELDDMRADGGAETRRQVDPDNLAYVIYTSGSTGSPKGVAVQHRSVCNHLAWMQSVMPIFATDRALLKYPINFDAAVYELFAPLTVGAQVFITEPSEIWDVSAFVRHVQDARVTLLDLVPSMLDALLEDGEFLACHTVRRVVVGGEALTRGLCERFHAQMRAELHNVYGPTETTIGATWFATTSDQLPERVPIGQAGWNTHAYVLDAGMNPVPPGVSAELYIGGDCLARGYVRQPGLTARRFVPDPFSTRPGARLYRTGDVARRVADGTLEYVGRVDDQVKVRGYRVEPREIEAVLSQHRLVRACSVVPVADGQDSEHLVAHVVPAPEPPELWPSVGEYDVYDELLYYAMTHDDLRAEAYRKAIAQVVAGRTVLDLGTGADAILARLCVEAGARHVYALERGADAASRASALIESLGVSDSIDVIHGDSSEVVLAESVDVCVSEILGTIGSSEGVISVLNDAWRFLKCDGTMIPRSCTTLFAPATLGESVVAAPGFAGLAAFYADRVFEKAGRPFDLRVCIKNARADDLLASGQVFETLDFSSRIALGDRRHTTFTVERSSRLDGFLLWLNLCTAQGVLLDSLNQQLSWLPAFFPVFYPGLEVSEGDVLEVTVTRHLSDGERFPDYLLEGAVARRSGEVIPFTYASPASARAYRAHPFYDALFATRDDAGAAPRDGTGPASHAGGGSAPDPGNETSHRANGRRAALPLRTELRRFLEARLPSYMVPSRFVTRQDLPMTPTGKIDRRALVLDSHSPEHSRERYVAPASQPEKLCATAWEEVLHLDRVGVHDNFFDLGGDSLLITQARVRLRSLFHRDIAIVDLFRYPTISALARYLEDGQPHADLREEADHRARKRRQAIQRLQAARTTQVDRPNVR